MQTHMQFGFKVLLWCYDCLCILIFCYYYAGIPSSPIISVKVSIGSITVTLQSSYPGVQPGDDSFFFYVTVFDDQSNIVYNMTFYGLNDKNITIDLPIGVYTVEVFSRNTYGMSDRITSTANVTMAMEASPTIEDGGGMLVV